MIVEGFYVDSSALRHLYAHDRRSGAMAGWRFKNPGALPITRFCRAEIINSMASTVFRGDIGEAAFQAFLAAFQQDLREDELRLVDVPWRAVLDKATELSERYTVKLGTRSLDVLHVASAMELNARYFLTYDARQAKLAAMCGLKIVQP